MKPALASASLFDAATETWAATGDLNTGRPAHRAMLIEETGLRRPFSLLDLLDPGPTFQGESRILDSPKGVCAG
jgi:hypothetical protein